MSARMRRQARRMTWTPDPVTESPLRRVDPRTKLALSLAVSLAVMLPLGQLVVAVGLYAIVLAWARLLAAAARQVWRLKWVLLGLFLIDWWFVSLELAVVVTVRLALLASTFILFFATTTPGELRQALEWFRIPYRYAFSLSLAFQSLSVLDEEWRTILEAQQARGAWQPPTGWRRLVEGTRDLVALSVPTIVLTAKRAWAMTEAAHARGFDSPRRKAHRKLALGRLDWILLGGSGATGLIFTLWRYHELIHSEGAAMSQTNRIILGIVVVIAIIGVVLGVDFFRRQGRRTSAADVPPGAIPIYVDGDLQGAFVPDDLAKLEGASFVDAEEGKTQEGWLLRDVLVLYVGENALNPETVILVRSSSRGKSIELTWPEVEDPDNMVMFDLSGRGTLKLVSQGLEDLDVRDEWVQDVDWIGVSTAP